MAEKGDRNRFFRAGTREAQRPPSHYSGARCLHRLSADSGSAEQQQASE
jgi:hypothetical protein